MDRARQHNDPCEPCPKCGGARVWKRAANKGGFRRYCSPCERTKARGRYSPGRSLEVSAAWRERNRDQDRARKRREYRENPAAAAKRAHRRRARLMDAPADGLAPSIGPNARCYICLSAPAEHVDHVVPLARGGSDTLANKQGACAACNLSKGDRRWPGQPGWAEWIAGRRPW